MNSPGIHLLEKQSQPLEMLNLFFSVYFLRYFSLPLINNQAALGYLYLLLITNKDSLRFSAYRYKYILRYMYLPVINN